jgi:hypothetical protein
VTDEVRLVGQKTRRKNLDIFEGFCGGKQCGNE